MTRAIILTIALLIVAAIAEHNRPYQCHTDIITVTATRKATGETVKVLSAATTDGQHWHVMTVPGIITTTFTN